MPSLTPDVDVDRYAQQYGGASDPASLRQSEARRRLLERWGRTVSGADLTLSLNSTEGETAHVVQSPNRPPDVEIPSWEIPQPATDYDRPVFDMLAQRTFTLHEVGHVLYTDQPSVGEAVAELPPEQREPFRSVWNALEDGAIEEQLRREFAVTEELAVLNANFMPPRGDREYGLLEAVHTACLDLAVYDTGQLSALLDEDDGSARFADPDDREMFEDDALPLVRDAATDVVTEPDAVARTERIREFWSDLLDVLDVEFDDEWDPPSGGKGDHSEDDNGEGQSADGLSDVDPDAVDDRADEIAGDARPDSDSDGSDDGGDPDGSSDGGDSDGSSDGGGDPDESGTDASNLDAGETGADGSADADESDADGSSERADANESGAADGADSGGNGEDGEAPRSESDDATPASGERDESDLDDREPTGEAGGDGPPDGESSDDGTGSSTSGSRADATDDRRDASTDAEGATDSGNGDEGSPQDAGGGAGAADGSEFDPGSVRAIDDRNDSLADQYRAMVTEERERADADLEETREELDAFQDVLSRLRDDGLGPRELDLVTDGEARSHVWPDVKRQGRTLADILEQRLQEERRSRTRRGLTRGRIDSRALPQVRLNNPRVFRQEETPDEKDYVAALVVDRSGSMSRQIHAAEQAATALAFALEEVGIETLVVDLCGSSPRLAKPASVDVESKLDALLSGQTSGGTPLAETLRLARERLEERGGNPFVVVVTDGQPSDQQAYLEELGRVQFPVLGVYLTFSAGGRTALPSDVRQSAALFDRRVIVTDEQKLLRKLESLCHEVMF